MTFTTTTASRTKVLGGACQAGHAVTVQPWGHVPNVCPAAWCSTPIRWTSGREAEKASTSS